MSDLPMPIEAAICEFEYRIWQAIKEGYADNWTEQRELSIRQTAVAQAPRVDHYRLTMKLQKVDNPE